jgi:2-iminobutanoate/2-iminopropanoate deaminase
MLKKVYTSNAPDAIGPYSQAIVANGFVFTSGQIPINPATNTVEAVTIEEQTEQALRNLQAILVEAGSSLDNVVKTTCFLADMNDFAAFNNVYGQFFTEKPARSCVAVKQLPKDVLVEVEVVAVLK